MSIDDKIFLFMKMTFFITHYNGLKKIIADVVTNPNFNGPILNVTVPVGREALLTCVVENIGSYKVAWLRVDTQTILTIQNHVLTKNQRIGITYSEHKTWQLRIRDIKESDEGWYMCQINTDPMKSQMGYLNVVVPPDILDYPTSTDMVIREGSNVTLKCAATGSPEPIITWKRENGEFIELTNGLSVPSFEGANLVIPRVRRQHMGAYLCIASNGVPPSVSKRIILIVHFPPMITVQNQLIGAVEGKPMQLECQSEAYPKSINYWTREKGEIVPSDDKYNSTIIEENEYKVTMKLNINMMTSFEFGSYRCIAKNSLGDTDGTIKVYRIPSNTINTIHSHERRNRGKKQKDDEFQVKNLNSNGNVENQGKPKDLVVRGNESHNIRAASSSSSNKLDFQIFCILSLIHHTAMLVIIDILRISQRK